MSFEELTFLAVFSILAHNAATLQKQEVSHVYKGCKNTNSSLNIPGLVRTMAFLKTDCVVYTQCFFSLLNAYDKKEIEPFICQLSLFSSGYNLQKISASIVIFTVSEQSSS